MEAAVAQPGVEGLAGTSVIHIRIRIVCDSCLREHDYGDERFGTDMSASMKSVAECYTKLPSGWSMISRPAHYGHGIVNHFQYLICPDHKIDFPEVRGDG